MPSIIFLACKNITLMGLLSNGHLVVGWSTKKDFGDETVSNITTSIRISDKLRLHHRNRRKSCHVRRFIANSQVETWYTAFTGNLYKQESVTHRSCSPARFEAKGDRLPFASLSIPSSASPLLIEHVGVFLFILILF